MKFVFHPEAEDEFFAAIEYYESVETGLGSDFSLEVLKTIQNAVDFPMAWPVLVDDIHRCLTNRFPYGVLYRLEGELIQVLAVMHLRREPGYWQERH
ncbi:MAG: type II toxin-antitoxin system RelE/ParE family toxin [Sulfurimicrobium sp.]|nr:type II toxin-antitoxin system RelE/ParE family toxin [Sulfurimicrobium sp.]MDO9190204.1 type II toxin-antitoxin system RelE/ParE family toxin [Sulfurimicrobium sp.]MDP1704247.1 type II toxin-antitoxin system RelE/ParE family toxin [Sulfurimicrobium sp.]MDP1896351.1 type II toxin-antitoxin system RelE/ParE family toxin [Sulfurimicrobium sp.]MDP2198894.1 type II toxin-antitoxin system RelE/ParE family toxin [Sulfurimicrobium sp.]